MGAPREKLTEDDVRRIAFALAQASNALSQCLMPLMKKFPCPLQDKVIKKLRKVDEIALDIEDRVCADIGDHLGMEILHTFRAEVRSRMFNETSEESLAFQMGPDKILE